MISDFKNDAAHVSAQWLLESICERGLNVKHILRIAHLGAKSWHILAVLDDGRCICDCCMGVNLGIPCRHFFQAWTSFKGLPFHIGNIRAR